MKSMGAIFAGVLPAAVMALALTPVHASPLEPGGPGDLLTDPLISQGEPVEVYFFGSFSNYHHQLSIFDASDPLNPLANQVFNSQSTPVGTRLELNLLPGVELVFRLHVLNTGNVFHSKVGDPDFANSDNSIHVRAGNWAGGGAIPLPGLLLGFEDLHINAPNYDGDFNDFMIVVRGVGFTRPEPPDQDLPPPPDDDLPPPDEDLPPPHHVPEPATLSLAAGALAMFGLLARRRRGRK